MYVTYPRVLFLPFYSCMMVSSRCICHLDGPVNSCRHVHMQVVNDVALGQVDERAMM